MARYVSTTTKQTPLEDNLLATPIDIPFELEQQLRAKGEWADTEELLTKDISRNKRAVIETMIALWALKSKQNSYQNRDNLECA